MYVYIILLVNIIFAIILYTSIKTGHPSIKAFENCGKTYIIFAQPGRDPVYIDKLQKEERSVTWTTDN